MLDMLVNSDPNDVFNLRTTLKEMISSLRTKISTMRKTAAAPMHHKNLVLKS
jgi:hypothetical protein